MPVCLDMFVALALATGLGAAQALWLGFIALDTTSSEDRSLFYCMKGFRSSLPASLAASLYT
jgi:hypothetical protein